MTKNEINNLLNETKKMANEEQEVRLSKCAKPDSNIKTILDALQIVTEMIENNWPLTSEEVSQLNMGAYAAKNLIPDFIDLATKVNELEYFLENPHRDELELL